MEILKLKNYLVNLGDSLGDGVHFSVLLGGCTTYRSMDSFKALGLPLKGIFNIIRTEVF